MSEENGKNPESMTNNPSKIFEKPIKEMSINTIKEKYMKNELIIEDILNSNECINDLKTNQKSKYATILSTQNIHKLISYCISKKNVRRPNINGAYNPFDNSYMTELDMSVQLYKDLVRDLPNTFCYFKLPDKNNFAFNPLNSTRNNPLKYNYYEGYLLIDNKCDKIKIARKSEEKYIVIFLKDIMNIHLSRQMINIIKIHK